MRKKISIFLLALVAGAGTMLASDTSVDGIWYNFDGEHLTAEVTYRGDDSESFSDRYSGEVVIPSSVTYSAQTYTVTSIGISAFEGCSGLTSVTIPNSVTSIGKWAFYYCSGLTSVTIPNSVTSIGKSAFEGCSSLTSVTIPSSVTSIGEWAFYGCSSLPVVDNLRYADNTYLVEAVDKTLSSYTIKDGTKWIGDRAFEECYNLASVTIPNSVTRIGDYAFYDCTGLTSVEIPNSVTSIGEDAFEGCSGLTSVTIPSSVTSIEYGTFSGCSGLTSVTIPNTVTSIGTGAFSGCSSLTSVTNYATTPQTIFSSVFYNVNQSTCVLNVPKVSKSLYQAANVWKEFTNIVGVDVPGEDPEPEPQPAGPIIPCTAADRGKVLCTDGSIYATVSEASAASKTAAAVITYVDTENGKALALALANESGTMNWETAKTTAAAHTPAVSGGTWTLPSKDDWDHMIDAAGGYGALCNGFSAVGGTNIQDGWYWTSVEYYSGAVVCLRLRPDQNNGGYAVWEDIEAYNVRACLAFDIPAAVNITPNVDPDHAGVYYSTFFDSAKKYALPAGVEAYVADLSGANLLLTKIAEEGEVIPANVAVILKSSVDQFTLTVSDADAVTFTATNDLLGVDAETAAPANCYVLSGTDQYGVGFYQILGNTLKAHKAYVIYTGNAAPKRMRFVFNQTTDVESIQPSAVSIQKILENGQVIIIRNGVRYNAAGQIVK